MILSTHTTSFTAGALTALLRRRHMLRSWRSQTQEGRGEPVKRQGSEGEGWGTTGMTRLLAASQEMVREGVGWRREAWARGAPGRQTGFQKCFISTCFLPLLDYREQSALSMRSEKADHLHRRMQCKITTPSKEQEGLMFVKAQQQHGHCVFSRLSCCLIECKTGLRLQKQA